jgi:uncharacterized Fe-S radical SAM superfamily protein PflX
MTLDLFIDVSERLEIIEFIHKELENKSLFYEICTQHRPRWQIEAYNLLNKMNFYYALFGE